MAGAEDWPEPDRIEGVPHPRETVRLFGQARAETRIRESLGAGRLAHGWLLAGPRGVGKATLAYRIARTMIAGADPAAGLDMAPDHPVFRRVAAQGEARLRVLRRAIDSRTGRVGTVIRADDVRGTVKDFLGLRAPDGGWRVVIVDSADDMNVTAATALLKFLEEPPERTLLLLVSHAPGALLPTIRSRVRVLELRPLQPDDLTAALAAAGAEVAPAEVPALEALAGGSVGEALRLIAAKGVALYAQIAAALAPGTLDRPAATRLAESAAGREAEPRYDAILRLTQLLVARLARAAAAGVPATAAAPAEPALMQAAASRPEQAPFWAEAAQRIAAVTTHGRAVNLDPAQVILDMFLHLDAALREARAAA